MMELPLLLELQYYIYYIVSKENVKIADIREAMIIDEDQPESGQASTSRCTALGTLSQIRRMSKYGK